MNKQNFLLVVFILTICSTVFGQSVVIPEDSKFYNPIINSFNKTIKEPSGNNNALQIQNDIDEISKKGGGVLTIKAGDKNQKFVINKEIEIKSNVHIRVEPDVVFTTSSPKKMTLFSAGKNGENRITNFSMSCTDKTKFYVFDFSKRLPGVKDGGAIAISIGGVENFKISDFKVVDNFTPYSCITVNLLETSKNEFLFAKNGIMEHIIQTNGHYGYGVIQNQAGYNILYRNLDGEGGATLRLETGASGKGDFADKRVRLDEIYGTDIKCKNGQAAITLSPHTIVNGKIYVENLTAISCEAGAIIASGFLSAKKGQKNKDGSPTTGYGYGSFDSNSIVSNLTVVYGTNAQLRGQRRGFIPCGQRYLVSDKKGVDEESFKGPTVSGIVYYAKGGSDKAEGYYTVKTPGLKMEGFPETDGIMENKEYVTKDDVINNCQEGNFKSIDEKDKKNKKKEKSKRK